MPHPITQEACPGCGGMFDPFDGPTHRYMTSSAACWHGFGNIIGAEFNNPELMTVHRMSVDSFAVQHPGDTSRQAIQSVGMHLARLLIAHDEIENIGDDAKFTALMEDFAARKQTLIYLDPPKHFTLTISDIEQHAGTTRHTDKVREWARATIDDWRDHHAYIRAWVAQEC